MRRYYFVWSVRFATAVSAKGLKNGIDEQMRKGGNLAKLTGEQVRYFHPAEEIAAKTNAEYMYFAPVTYPNFGYISPRCNGM